MRIVFLLLNLVLPMAAQATVFWDDDFENHLYPNWEYSASDPTCATVSNQDATGCNPGLSTTRAHSGTHSVHGHYTGENSGTYMDRSFTASTDFYERVWVYLDSFSAIQCPNPGCAGTKNIFNFGDVSFSNWWMFSYNGDQHYYVESQTPADNPGGVDVLNENLTQGVWAQNQWICLEWHTKVNTPGQSNGQIEMWVNGTRTMNYPNYNLDANGGTLFYTRHYVQHGLGDIYWDDHAVGDTRIGCGGGVGSTAGGGLDF